MALIAAIAMLFTGKAFNGKADGNLPFTRRDLEGAATREVILDSYEGASNRARSDLGKQLGLSYSFRVFLYYAIASLCYMASLHHTVKNIAITGSILSFAQVLAHLADSIETFYLYKYRSDPHFGGPFLLYQFAVKVKGGVANTGGFFAVLLVLYNRLAYGHFLFYQV